MSEPTVYPIRLTIEILHPINGWSRYQTLAFKDTNAAKKRLFKVTDQYFKAYPHVRKIRGIIESYPELELIDKFESDRDDY